MPPNYFGSEGNDEDRKKDDSKTTRNVAPHPPQAAEPRAQLRAAPSLALGLARGAAAGAAPRAPPRAQPLPTAQSVSVQVHKVAGYIRTLIGFFLFF